MCQQRITHTHTRINEAMFQVIDHQGPVLCPFSTECSQERQGGAHHLWVILEFIDQTDYEVHLITSDLVTSVRRVSVKDWNYLVKTVKISQNQCSCRARARLLQNFASQLNYAGLALQLRFEPGQRMIQSLFITFFFVQIGAYNASHQDMHIMCLVLG